MLVKYNNYEILGLNEFNINQASMAMAIFHLFPSDCITLYILEREYIGPIITMKSVSKEDIGAYLCIAQNGVPPAVSRRIILQVKCKIMLKLKISFKQTTHSKAKYVIDTQSIHAHRRGTHFSLPLPVIRFLENEVFNFDF